jgi:hypothetical protein
MAPRTERKQVRESLREKVIFEQSLEDLRNRVLWHLEKEPSGGRKLQVPSP